MKKKFHKIIKNLEQETEKCKKSPNHDPSYIEGVEHAIRYIRIKFQDAVYTADETEAKK